MSPFQFENESCAFAVSLVKAEASVHPRCAQCAYRQSEAVAFGEVAHISERLEQVIPLFLSDSAPRVGDDILVGVGPAFF